jgi:hypothetical protein
VTCASSGLDSLEVPVGIGVATGSTVDAIKMLVPAFGVGATTTKVHLRVALV